MVELHAVYENGELRLPDNLDPLTLKDSRVKVVVTVPNGPDHLLSREQQDNLREKLLAANPAELKVKIEHDADLPSEPALIAAARSAEEKLRAYWTMKGTPPVDRQDLVVAGGLVTSRDAGLSVPDWPLSYGKLMPPMEGGILYEHGHRMVATTVGLLTIVSMIWLFRAESRKWLRGWAVVALVAVIVQGVLGGLTVLFLLPWWISTSHACLAQLFFSTTVAIALFTSDWWLRGRRSRRRPAVPDSRPFAGCRRSAFWCNSLWARPRVTRPSARFITSPSRPSRPA